MMDDNGGEEIMEKEPGNNSPLSLVVQPDSPVEKLSTTTKTDENIDDDDDDDDDPDDVAMASEDLQSKINDDDNQKLREEYEQQISELRSQIERQKSESRKELEDIRTTYENRIKHQQLESIRNENILIMRLTLKEQELQDCLAQIETLQNIRQPNIHQLESFLLDPALNYIYERMKKEVDQAKLRVEEMQNDINAWKFSADSITGKQLMSKCRQLHQENEELGKMISSGKIAKLESGLAMHKNYSETLNKSQADIDDVLNEIEENVEGFQNTVYYLQQQLKESKEKYENIIGLIQTECQCERLKNQVEILETESSSS